MLFRNNTIKRRRRRRCEYIGVHTRKADNNNNNKGQAEEKKKKRKVSLVVQSKRDTLVFAPAAAAVQSDGALKVTLTVVVVGSTCQWNVNTAQTGVNCWRPTTPRLLSFAFKYFHYLALKGK